MYSSGAIFKLYLRLLTGKITVILSEDYWRYFYTMYFFKGNTAAYTCYWFLQEISPWLLRSSNMYRFVFVSNTVCWSVIPMLVSHLDLTKSWHLNDDSDIYTSHLACVSKYSAGCIYYYCNYHRTNSAISMKFEAEFRSAP